MAEQKSSAFSRAAGVAGVLWCAALLSMVTSTAPVAVVAAEPRDAATAAPLALQTPQNIGTAGCTTSKCHAKELDWSRKLDGDGKGKQHINADDQLSAKQYKDVTKYLAAVAQKDPYDLKGACVRCHTTVVAGDPEDGITCQSCHGPGSLYNKPHQEEGAYDKGVALPGLNKFINKPEIWAKVCNDCHILSSSAVDMKLRDAGHSTGFGAGELDFVLSKKFDRIAPHWKSAKKHTVQTIAALDRLRGSPPGAKPDNPIPPPPPPPDPPKPNPPRPDPPKPNPPKPDPAKPNPPKPEPPRPEPPRPEPPRPEPPRPVGSKPEPPRPGPPKPEPPKPMPVPPEAPPPLMPPPMPAVGPALAQTPVALVGSLQGRLIALLDSLLRQNVSRPITAPPPTTTYSGPNADLLRLQQEVIALALQALSAEPRKATAPDAATK